MSWTWANSSKLILKQRIGQRVCTSSCQLLENSSRLRDGSPKEYPSFTSLHDPLHIYLNIIMHQLIMSGSQANLIEFTHGSRKYISGLYLKGEWPQVLEYHFKFHSRCIIVMQEGIYTGWGHINGDLMSLHIFGNPKACEAQ